MELTLHFLILFFLNFSVGLDFLKALNFTDITSSFCTPYEQIEHGKITLLENIVSDDISQQTIHIQCTLGFDLVGPPKISCIDGQWEQTVRPHCVARCNTPPNISMGDFQIEDDISEDGMYKKGTLATYTCKDGYELTPPESKYRVCEKGIWTGANATCVLSEQITGCKPPKDVLNGYYVHEKPAEPDGIYSIGQRLHFSCKPGYALDGERFQLCLEDGTWSPKRSPICIPESIGEY